MGFISVVFNERSVWVLALVFVLFSYLIASVSCLVFSNVTMFPDLRKSPFTLLYEHMCDCVRSYLYNCNSFQL